MALPKVLVLDLASGVKDNNLIAVVVSMVGTNAATQDYLGPYDLSYG